jgi:hypothetical protein
MDDAIGSDVAVVGTPGALARWGDITADASVPVVATAPGAGSVATTVAEDVAEWLAEHDATMAILRPDRYVHALARDDHEAAQALHELCVLISRG